MNLTTTSKTTSGIGSESCNTIPMEGFEVAALLAELNLANNGYLFAPTPAQLKTAQHHDHIFTVANGLIFRKGEVPAQYPDPCPPARFLLVDGPDYEALILDRQANAGLYD